MISCGDRFFGSFELKQVEVAFYGSSARARYSVGVTPVSFLKAVQKLLSLEKPTAKQMLFTESPVLWSRNFALLIRVARIYRWGENPGKQGLLWTAYGHPPFTYSKFYYIEKAAFRQENESNFSK